MVQINGHKRSLVRWSNQATKFGLSGSITGQHFERDGEFISPCMAQNLTHDPEEALPSYTVQSNTPMEDMMLLLSILDGWLEVRGKAVHICLKPEERYSFYSKGGPIQSGGG